MKALRACTDKTAEPEMPFTLNARMVPDSRIFTSGLGVPMTAPMVMAKIVIEAARVVFISGVMEEKTAPITKKKTNGTR